jgi:Skp family chaperone for outer membrane proteins
MEVSPLGRPSETSFRVLETFGTKLSQLALFPKTGRTHQIRVHLSAIGHPIVGDQAYGAKSVWGQEFGIKRPLLHAEELKIVHPLTGKDATFKAPWPEDLKLARIRFREVFKLAAVFLVAAALGATPLAAQESSAKSGAKSSKSASAKLSALKSKVQKLQSELETLQDSVENLSKSMAEVDASRRLNDLEHALSEINGKVGGAATGTEEVKTQLLEVGRRLKGQQDTLEGLRDAMDRVQREVIQLKAMQEGAPAAAAPAGSKASAP